MKNKICLMGMPGCGKSTVGKLLAEKLHFEFIDLDAEIEKTTQKTISQIFETEGETSFRQKEKEALKQALQKENTVIALGGGTPCFFDNMDKINAAAFSVYLNTPVTILHQRLLKEQAQRPLLAGKTPDALLAYLQDKLKERSAFFESAAVQIDCSKKDAAQITQETIQKIVN
jgi:shikimate kinase